MATRETLTEDRAAIALHAINKTHDLLGYLIRDAAHSEVMALAECARKLLDEAADHLDRPFPEGGA